MSRSSGPASQPFPASNGLHLPTSKSVFPPLCEREVLLGLRMTVMVCQPEQKNVKLKQNKPPSSISKMYKQVKHFSHSTKVRCWKSIKNKLIKTWLQVNSSTGMEQGVSHCSHDGSDPCPIGTRVSLGATVWYEDSEGLLVVNVEWRGRTYVGTLIDTSKQTSINNNR